MKISAQQYAQSLFDSVAGKSEKEVKAILKSFVAILGKNRELNKEVAIVTAFLEIWNQEHGEVVATLESARELGPTARETVVDYLKTKTDAAKIILEENIDKDLIGGFVLRYGSKVLDGSLKNSLNSLKNKISN
ncbi:MAG: ATP synthase F1 subunit delta [Candidatus Falkowbacteria bacterium]|nr:ATP synthase F1 subunit delta [Candidatus Falkowbacteria bacterium]